MRKIQVRGDCVEDGGARRDVGFYDRFEILTDEGRELFGLRVLEDGSLEISTTLSVVRHGDVRLDNKLIVRPQDSGRIIVNREQYKEL